MATRETRLERGRRRGRIVVSRLIGELVATRQSLNVSQRALARELRCSQAELWRRERLARIDRIPFVALAEMASLLGYDISAALHALGDPIRDRGHQELLKRFRATLAATIRVAAEAPLPNLGDRRSWDLLLRCATQLIGVEAETRIRDIQLLVRRIRERERDGGVDEIVLVLSESVVNRRLLPELLEALGARFTTPPRALLKALRAGKPLPGSGVILL